MSLEICSNRTQLRVDCDLVLAATKPGRRPDDSGYRILGAEDNRRTGLAHFGIIN